MDVFFFPYTPSCMSNCFLADGVVCLRIICLFHADIKKTKEMYVDLSSLNDFTAKDEVELD